MASALRARLNDSDRRLVTKQGTNDREAYELYVRGRYAWNKRTPADVRQAVTYFNRAIDKDPGYAMAYAGLADALLLLPEYGDTSSDDIPRSDAAARKALELDPSLAHPHAVLGSNAMSYHGDFAGGEAEFRRAFALDSGDATAHQWYGERLAMLGRGGEAIAEGERARALDPLSPIVSAVLGWIYALSGRYDQAIAVGQQVIRENPGFVMGHFLLEASYLSGGKAAQAVEEEGAIDSLFGGPDGPRQARAVERAFQSGGERAALEKVLESRKADWKRGVQAAYNVAAVAAFMGDRDEAFHWLDIAYQQHSWLLMGLGTDILFDSLHTDPRFTELVRKVSLPPQKGER